MNKALDPLLQRLANYNAIAFGNAIGRGRSTQNEIKKRTKNIIARSLHNRRTPNNIGLTNSQWNRIKNLHTPGNLNGMTRNTLVIRFPNKFTLTPRQLKDFFRRYGNVMLKINRNRLAGRNRTGMSALNVYYKGFPSSRSP
jgi:hypothetical protein